MGPATPIAPSCSAPSTLIADLCPPTFYTTKTKHKNISLPCPSLYSVNLCMVRLEWMKERNIITEQQDKTLPTGWNRET